MKVDIRTLALVSLSRWRLANPTPLTQLSLIAKEIFIRLSAVAMKDYESRSSYA